MSRPDANLAKLCYIYRAMKRSIRRRNVAYPVLILMFLLAAGTGGVAAQTAHPQPELLLVFGSDTEALNEAESEARRLLYAAVEARFNAQRRYRLSRTLTDLPPEQFVAEEDGKAETAGSSGSAILFLRVTPRLDGSIRVDADVYHGGGFRASFEDDLPTGDERFPEVDRIANDLTDTVAALYPGFGRVRFTNPGYPANYVLRIDGLTIGSNINEIDLPVGSYEIEIRRRDDRFSHPIGRRTIRLGDDDFYEIVFSLDRTPPVVPGYMRLTDPTDRWRAIFTLRGSGLIPLNGIQDFTPTESWSATATALFAGIPFRAAVMGVEAGHVRLKGTVDTDDTDADPTGALDATLSVEMSPILGTLGLTVGPVSGVDFVVRGGGGVVLYRINEKVEFENTTVYDYQENRIDPAFSGTVEFGFGLGGNTRLSLQTAVLGVVSDGDIYSWLQLGIGVGGRF
jgi:hypothetical protein